jgi:radical SAM superfamily enzyme YgiQ (UPF0313 family)
VKLTLIHPCIGRRAGESYIRSWQMEPLAPAALAGLTPPEVEIRFHDDRMEAIPCDEPTDLVAISVETYTARRAYQIASLYRRRGVPVVMGGFHATLVPEEVCQYAESVVVGEAENIWPRLIEDFRAGRLRRIYRDEGRPSLQGRRPDRSIFAGKRYLPVGLVEASRGCPETCEFCSIQSAFGCSQTWRPVDEIVEEVRRLDKPLIFFVDDNLTGDRERAKELLRKLIPLKIRWVGQAALDAGTDPELLQLLRLSGCQGLLIGLESLDERNLRQMDKAVNRLPGGYEAALLPFRRHGIRLYATFVFGYDQDCNDSFPKTLAFALRHRFYLAAFNHLTPFPGTPLYRRLQQEGRLLFERWWLDPDYRYGMLPFAPAGMSADEVMARCIEARRAFFSWGSIFRRSLDFSVNSRNFFMWFNFFGINGLMRREVLQRAGYPLGDETFDGPLLKTADRQPVELLEPQGRDLPFSRGATA